MISRADLHIHSLASDGTVGGEEILRAAVAADLALIAITDHERIDAAKAAQALARARGLALEVVVGEEISTRGGHLLGLWLTESIRPWQSLRDSIAAVHAQEGLAVIAHPLFPYPLCAQGPALRRLLADPDLKVHPDALEVFNPTPFGRAVHERVARFATTHGLAGVGGSDAHGVGTIGHGFTTYPGSTGADLRAAILGGQSEGDGSFGVTSVQLSIFGRQLRKYGRDVAAEAAGRLRRDGTGRDHGYPGGNSRPPRFEPER